MRDGDFKFILHYQDHLTKFAVLRPLTSKLAAEVGFQLLDIFLLFGAPHILQSHNGREFTEILFPSSSARLRCSTKSSSDSNEQRSPCGREDVDSPIFASQPNIALYGDLFIPE
jgi:hypothetical protein